MPEATSTRAETARRARKGAAHPARELRHTVGAEIADLRSKDMSWRRIADLTRVPVTTARRWFALHAKNGPGGGRNANRGLSQPLTSQEQP